MSVPAFASMAGPLARRSLTTLQLNLGKLCNQACLHCHVEAGPKRTEQMTEQTADRIVALMRQGREHIDTVDLTGGAPELNGSFRRLVREARSLGFTVIDRCNLTVLLLEGQEDTVSFLAGERVDVTASLPCYSPKNVEKQRGRGVFGQSIEALQRLNEVGYGKPGTGLVLNLVYNPGGAFLPPDQGTLEATYKQRLRDDFGVHFNQLFTLTNMPIKRFRDDLNRAGRLNDYLGLLHDNFNHATVGDVMCRDQISISWDGRLYDCDFNQMLDLEVEGSQRTIWDVQSLDELVNQPIVVASHCYGCTAGAGSSCGGSLE
jgi:radical SAM/Cys-rich protein